MQKSRGKAEVDDFLKNEGRKIAMVLQRQTVDSTWVSAHFSELVKRYAEMYIAVRRRQVLGASPNYEALRSDLTEKFGKVDDDMTIEFITTKRLQLLH